MPSGNLPISSPTTIPPSPGASQVFSVAWPVVLANTKLAVDFTRQMQVGTQAGGPATILHSDAQIEIINDSDVAWTAHFDNYQAGVIITPGEGWSAPVPYGASLLFLYATYQNPTQQHVAETVTATFYNPVDLRAGYKPRVNYNVNPSGAGGAGLPVFNVKTYGATGKGSPFDDTIPIQSAITAAQNAGGGIVFFPTPSVSYGISQPLVISADNIWLLGTGFGSLITLASTFTVPNPLIQVNGPGGAGNFRYGIVIQQLFLDGGSLSGVSGIDLVSTYAALISHVRIRHIGTSAIGVHWDGISGAFGAYNTMFACHITDGAGTGVQTDNSEWLTILGGSFDFWNNAGAGIAANIRNLNCRLIGVGFDHNDTAVFMNFAGRTQIKDCQFDRGATTHINMHGCKNCTILANVFASDNQTTGVSMITVSDVGTTGNVVEANDAVAGGGWTNFLAETSANLNAPQNLYANNQTGGYAISRTAGTGTGITRGNTPFNPVGPGMAQIPVPASGTPQTNNTGVDATVVISTLGTLTAVAIGGTAVPGAPAVGSSYRVPNGQTITYTYGGAAPTVQCYGD